MSKRSLEDGHAQKRNNLAKYDHVYTLPATSNIEGAIGRIALHLAKMMETLRDMEEFPETFSFSPKDNAYYEELKTHGFSQRIVASLFKTIGCPNVYHPLFFQDLARAKDTDNLSEVGALFPPAMISMVTFLAQETNPPIAESEKDRMWACPLHFATFASEMQFKLPLGVPKSLEKYRNLYMYQTETDAHPDNGKAIMTGLQRHILTAVGVEPLMRETGNIGHPDQLLVEIRNKGANNAHIHVKNPTVSPLHEAEVYYRTLCDPNGVLYPSTLNPAAWSQTWAWFELECNIMGCGGLYQSLEDFFADLNFGNGKINQEWEKSMAFNLPAGKDWKNKDIKDLVIGQRRPLWVDEDTGMEWHIGDTLLYYPKGHPAEHVTLVSVGKEAGFVNFRRKQSHATLKENYCVLARESGTAYGKGLPVVKQGTGFGMVLTELARNLAARYMGLIASRKFDNISAIRLEFADSWNLRLLRPYIKHERTFDKPTENAIRKITQLKDVCC